MGGLPNESVQNNMVILALDIGTTNLKGAIINEKGEILQLASKGYEVVRKNGRHYIDVKGLTAATFDIIEELKRGYLIAAVCVSGLGESFIPIDKNGNALDDSMLYSDMRAEQECNEIIEKVGLDRIIEITGLNPHYMYSVPKILWLKKNCREIFENTHKFLLIGDYIGYLLTGEFVIDYSLASRTMAFDVHKKQFSDEILKAVGVNKDKFSTPIQSGKIVGKVKREILEDCYLASGGHDQICAALGSGVSGSGGCNNGMGTVECITPIFEHTPCDSSFAKNGYALVPYAAENLYATYAFNFTGGVAMQWFKENIVKRNFDNFFEYYGSNMPKSSSELIFLPHLLGSGTPYMDSKAKGALLNLTLETTDFDIFKAIIEGTCFEMLINIEKLNSYNIGIRQVTASGGGSKSRQWLQTKADIYGTPIYPLISNEAGLIGCGILAFNALGEFGNLTRLAEQFVKRGEAVLPNLEQHMFYREKFEIYKRIYRQIKNLKGEF